MPGALRITRPTPDSGSPPEGGLSLSRRLARTPAMH